MTDGYGEDGDWIIFVGMGMKLWGRSGNGKNPWKLGGYEIN